ncbi:hypothetical protein GEU84_000260 [Fertoebacter nigrum]|uniref:Uncharacterized protein n=1 Tax=Fertoeibacter niger TaxID=2656921 RepID=A0A8X8GZS5_9RHOB|nr:hypothetical protein [Fertoeibacter niger]NUB42803.1 hypothetical protein [Fertoeibacter niger]
MWRAAVLVLALAAPAAGQEAYYPDPPPGYPPVLGDVAATLGRDAVAWQTYDFSIGAFDASAWIDTYDGITFKLIGYTPGDPDAETGRLRVAATYASTPQVGSKPTALMIEIFDDGLEGPRLSSQGRAAVLEITAIELGSGSGYGSMSGRLTAELCPRGGKNGACRKFSGTFDTGLQFSGL